MSLARIESAAGGSAPLRPAPLWPELRSYSALSRLALRALKRPFFGRYMRPWRAPPELEAEGWERVVFPSGTGARLHGVLGAPTSAPGRGALVLAHPMGTAAKGFFLKQGLAVGLRARGFHVLAFDFNGFGESGMGDFRYPLDVLAAARVLQERVPAAPLGVLGVSFGAAWSLCAIASTPSLFRAAVFDSAFTTLDEFWQRYPVPYAVLRTISAVYPGLSRSLRPVEQAQALDPAIRALFIYGADDEITPPRMGQRLRSAAPRELKSAFWEVPHAGHTAAFRTASDEYLDRVAAHCSA